jgi:3D (Asp-Asp-Asp) domain-containing protein
MLLIGGIVTVLPAAAFVPSLLTNDQSQTPLLVAVDELTTATRANAVVNENAVRGASRIAKPQASPVFPAPLRVGVWGWVGQAPSLFQTPLTSAEKSESAIGIKTDVVHDPDTRWFNGRPVRPARTLSMLVTAYSPDERSCGESADGITASGYSVWTNGMKMVAADTDVLPFGALISVPGYDDANIVPVLDRGAAIKGHRLDVLYPTHEQAERWGVQRLNVIVWEYADGKPCDFETQHALVARE